MPNISVLTIPSGSQLTSTIQSNEDPSKNDFEVIFTADGNFTLVQSDVRLTTRYSIQEFEGKGCTYRAVIRPPETAGVLTITIAQNAVPEGNPAVRQEIRLSTDFPDDDAEMPTLLFSTTDGYNSIAVTSTRILLGRSRGRSALDVTKFTHDGTEDTTLTAGGFRDLYNARFFDYINGDVLVRTDETSAHAIRFGRYDGSNLKQRFALPFTNTRAIPAAIHTRLGYTSIRGRGLFTVLPYGFESTADEIEIDASETFPSGAGYNNLTHQNDLLFLMRGAGNMGVAEIIDVDTIRFIRQTNIKANLPSIGGLFPGSPRPFDDLSIYQDTLYYVYALSTDPANRGVHTLDIRPYRPLAKRTKTEIYPILASNGDTIPLKQFCPDAKDFTFSVGFDKPSFLSINTNNEIAIANNAVTETTPVLVKVTGINFVDAIDMSFYLIIVPTARPAVRDIDELSMLSGSSFDLNALVERGSRLQTAPTVSFRSGYTQPTGSTLSDGVFTIGSVGGMAYFTVTNAAGSTHFAIKISVVQQDLDVAEFSEISRDRVEIAGHDVTPHLIEISGISESLDDVSLNEFRVSDATVVLRSANGRFNTGIQGNFWESHGLNAGGYQERIDIFKAYLVAGRWVSHLRFSGLISRPTENITGARVSLLCRDISGRLRDQTLRDFGTLQKWDTLRPESEEASYQDVYTPEGSLLPMQPETGKAWQGRTPLTLRRLPLPSEGPPLSDSGYLTEAALHTSRGVLSDLPIAGFKTQHRSEDVAFVANQLGHLAGGVYQVNLDVDTPALANPYILNRGSIGLSVEQTRITRVPVDWVVGVESGSHPTVLILLSNPEGHIADLLVQYNINGDSYRVLHTFEKDVKVHRIARRNATNYYILTSKPISQDRSAPQLPRPADATGYAYDSLAEGSEINIYHYNSGTNTLTAHVAEDDSFPAQLGIHYWIGFENSLYIDEFEGIRPEYRGPFKWHSGNLYYRYAKAGEFGVARVGVTNPSQKLIGQDIGVTGETPKQKHPSHTHLNFAFDINSSGTIYFVYATGGTETSTLTIKRRTSSGTETTLLSETRGVGDFNELGFDFGAFLGAHEVLFHNNQLYILAPIQKVDFGDDTRSIVNPDVHIEQRSAEKTGERNVTTATNVFPSNQIVAPGEDIPLRIDFDGVVSGATQSDLTVYGGTIQSFSSSSDMIDVTIRPDSKTRHKNIIIDLAEDAVDQTNEAWRIVVDFETARSRTKTAGMALYRVSTNTANPALEVVETWDFVQRGGCNLVVHDGAVHYMEHPPALTHFKPINPDLENYWTDEAETETLGYNQIADPLGALKKVDSTGAVESLGNLWFDNERPYNITATRALSIGDSLHIVMGYGSLDELLRYNSQASQVDNVQHLVYGKTLQRVVTDASFSGSVYDAFLSLAKLLNATLSFRSNIVEIRGRSPLKAEMEGSTGTGTGDLGFQNAKGTFPSSGYLRIGDEFLKYTGLRSGAFTGMTRGVLGTPVADHPDESECVFLRAVIGAQLHSGNVVITADTARIFNVIRNTSGTVEVRDPESIEKYGEKVYTLDFGKLTDHDLAWQEELMAAYLETLKDGHSQITLKLRHIGYLRLGDVIGVQYGDLVYSVQILSLKSTPRSTEIRGRTVPVRRVPSVPVQPTQVHRSASGTDFLTVRWDPIVAYPAVERVEIRIATSQSGLAAAAWVPADTLTQHTFRRLTAGRTYYMQVRGINAEGVSPASDVFSAVLHSLPMANERLSLQRGERSLTATWRIGDAFPALEKQQIRWSDSEEGLASTGWTDIGARTTRYILRDLQPLTTYFVEVRGVNAEGNGPAVRASGQTLPARGVPRATTLSLTETGDHQLRVGWTLPAAYPALDKQQIRWATSEAALDKKAWTDIAADATTYTITGLDNGTRVYAQVRGVNAEGEGTASNTASGRPMGIPEALTGFALTAEDKQLVANWRRPVAFPALTKQQLRWATSEAALSRAGWQDVAADATSWTITGLDNGTRVYAQGRGVNAEGEGPASTVTSAIPRGKPDAATGLALAAGSTQVIATWTIGHAFPALTKQQIRWATSTTALDGKAWTDIAADATDYTITGLVNGTPVYAQVRGVNEDGEGPASTTASATPAALQRPVKVTGLRRVSQSGNTANIAWNAIASATHYEYRVRSVIRYQGRDFSPRTYQDWTSTGSSATTATIGLSRRTAGALAVVNFVEVRAVNPLGTGPASDVLEIIRS